MTFYNTFSSLILKKIKSYRKFSYITVYGYVEECCDSFCINFTTNFQFSFTSSPIIYDSFTS